MATSGLPPSLLEALHQSREWGFLGEGPVDTHVAHALGFAAAVDSMAEATTAPLGGSGDRELLLGPWMDLGSGGGIPGLVLAHQWPDREAVLLDSNQRRTRFLSQVVENEGWGGRVRVVAERAEVAGRVEELRAAFSLVVARSFASPPTTAECAAPFLRRRGVLVVSEPPSDSTSAGAPGNARWPEEGLRLVGLAPVSRWGGAFEYQILRQSEECPDRFPRRVGIPGKRPIYHPA